MRSFEDSAHYPPERADHISATARGVGGCLLVVGAVTAGLAYLMLLGGPVFLAALAGAALLLSMFGGSMAVRDSFAIRITPYYERPVPGSDTFLCGYAIARHLGALDELAAEHGIPPLSSFGYGDDLRGDTVVWHDAGEGLATVRAVMETVRSQVAAGPQADSVLKDLAEVAQGLELAQAGDTRFGLLMLHGDTTSGHEMSLRKGTFF